MKTHIVVYGAYYYAELVGSCQQQFYPNLILQYRTRVGDIFASADRIRTFPTRLEAYRWMFFNIKDLHSSWYSRRRICYSYSKLAHILSKLYPEDFI